MFSPRGGELLEILQPDIDAMTNAFEAHGYRLDHQEESSAWIPTGGRKPAIRLIFARSDLPQHVPGSETQDSPRFDAFLHSDWSPHVGGRIPYRRRILDVRGVLRQVRSAIRRARD